MCKMNCIFSSAKEIAALGAAATGIVGTLAYAVGAVRQVVLKDDLNEAKADIFKKINDGEKRIEKSIIQSEKSTEKRINTVIALITNHPPKND